TKQDVKKWYQCYHSSTYPITKFMQMDTVNESVGSVVNTNKSPMAHSTLMESIPSEDSTNDSRIPTEYSYSVGHISHIPRIPPTPTTFTIPSVLNANKSDSNEDPIFGMIKLGGNDVCYTSGTIEWVGRKRTFPLNTGFKILDKHTDATENLPKKVRKTNVTFIHEGGSKDCECADVLPTVNAIVDHLNALHEAVDLVDLRLCTVEDVVSKN
ncbi:uncharacterized protein LOC126970429, partial [Leptidea sinapis]|uniref:uncharacterized protein LOC126970429 n=1 Tax=Leptidea sinapis TaxID=189913 RepID=UPI0021C2BF00